MVFILDIDKIVVSILFNSNNKWVNAELKTLAWLLVLNNVKIP